MHKVMDFGKIIEIADLGGIFVFERFDNPSTKKNLGQNVRN
jgi:hypothetical protein